MTGTFWLHTSMAMLAGLTAQASASMARTLVEDGMVGVVAPRRWLAITSAYIITIGLWGLLSTLLVRQLAATIRRPTAIPETLGVVASFGFYVLAWGIPSGSEWIWAVALNLWQGVGTVRDTRKKLHMVGGSAGRETSSGGAAEFVSQRGVADLLRMPSSPLLQKFFGEEFFDFHEPGTPTVIDPVWTMAARAEFRRDPKLGLIYGGPGQVIFRSAHLEQVLLKKSGQIRDWGNLLVAFRQCGYRTARR